MLDGFVAAITAPLEFEHEGDHVLVTMRSGNKVLVGSMSRADLFTSGANARRCVSTWNGTAAPVIKIGAKPRH